MDFTNFTALVKDEVEKRAGENCRVQVNDVRKNNGVVLRGLTVLQDGINISPTIYLNGYYESYGSGKATLDSVIDDVMNAWHKNKVDRSVDIGYFTDYERVRRKIVYKIINTEKNRELLEDVPHVEFLDLSLVFRCLVAEDNPGTASILIHNSHMQLWGVSATDLYHAAKENTPRLLPGEIKGMNDVICELEDFNTDCVDYVDNLPMYVLSNRKMVDGAACMLYPDLIKNFSKKAGSSIYIIPSSVHECLLLPADNTDDAEEIRAMIREVNDTQVKEEEILSYSVYFYDMKTNQILRV